MIQKEEVPHVISILQETKKALVEKNSVLLRQLSDTTVHAAASNQDSASISIAVIIYTLSKLIERQDYSKIKNWDTFIKKFNANLDLAISCLHKDKCEKYEDFIENAREMLTSQSIDLKPYIQDVLQKSAINKGSKIYEHGVSLEQTSKLLGVSLWELTDYIGQKTLHETHGETINEKTRAKTALEFFS